MDEMQTTKCFRTFNAWDNENGSNMLSKAFCPLKRFLYHVTKMIHRELMFNILCSNNLPSMFKKMTCTDSVWVTKRKPAIWSHPITVCVSLYLLHWWKVSDWNHVNFMMTVFENLPGSHLMPLTDVSCLLSQWGFLVCQVYNEGNTRFELYCIKKNHQSIFMFVL